MIWEAHCEFWHSLAARWNGSQEGHSELGAACQVTLHQPPSFQAHTRHQKKWPQAPLHQKSACMRVQLTFLKINEPDSALQVMIHLKVVVIQLHGIADRGVHDVLPEMRTHGLQSSCALGLVLRCCDLRQQAARAWHHQGFDQLPELHPCS
jgi:hypothetical protein